VKRIEQMYAFIAEDEDGEGLAAWQTSSGIWAPLVAADAARVDSLRRLAQVVADASGQTLRLVRFEVRTELEEFTPKET
jgi:hypothetical protein